MDPQTEHHQPPRNNMNKMKSSGEKQYDGNGGGGYRGGRKDYKPSSPSPRYNRQQSHASAQSSGNNRRTGPRNDSPRYQTTSKNVHRVTQDMGDHHRQYDDHQPRESDRNRRSPRNESRVDAHNQERDRDQHGDGGKDDSQPMPRSDTNNRDDSQPEPRERNGRPQNQQRRNYPRGGLRGGRNNDDRRYSNDRRNNDRRGSDGGAPRRNNARYNSDRRGSNNRSNNRRGPPRNDRRNDRNDYRNDRRRHNDNVREDSSGRQVLHVAGTTHAKRLAGAISHIARETVCPVILAGGPEGVNQAIKAISIARNYVEENRIDISVTCESSKRREDGREDGRESGGFRFILEKTPLSNRRPGNDERRGSRQSDDDKNAPDDEQKEMKVSKDSTPGKVAGAIAKRVRDHQRVALSCIGPLSVFRLVHSIATARRYLHADGFDISFKPEFNNVTLSNGMRSSALKFVVLARQI